jgi:hypothetical protein
VSALAESLAGLPGADLVLRGLEDLARAQATPEAALVEVARTRLRELGLPVPGAATGEGDAELRLYAGLGERHRDRDPYVLYCAWLDQLESFLAALEGERGRLQAPSSASSRRSR